MSKRFRVPLLLLLVATLCGALAPPAAAGRASGLGVRFYEGRASFRRGEGVLWAAIYRGRLYGSITEGNLFGELRLVGTRRGRNARGALYDNRNRRIGTFRARFQGGRIRGSYRRSGRPQRAFRAREAAPDRRATRLLTGEYRYVQDAGRVRALLNGSRATFDVRATVDTFLGPLTVARVRGKMLVDRKGFLWILGRGTYHRISKRLPKLAVPDYYLPLKVGLRTRPASVEIRDPFDPSRVLVRFRRR